MNKKALLALLLVMSLLLSSCALVVKNEAVDAATPIITVGDTVYTKTEVQTSVNSYLDYMASYYSNYYGYTIDTTSETVISSAQDEVIDMLVEEAVKAQKITELGLDLTDEETAEVDEEYNSYYDLFASMMGTSTDLTEEEQKAQIEYYMYSYFGVTHDSMIESKKEEKLKAYAVKDVVVTDEEIQADFDSKVEEAKTSYESDLSAYGTAVNNGDTVYYRPAGYRMVKNLLVKLTDADSTAISSIQSKATEQSTAMDTAKAAVEAVEGADLEALAAQCAVTVAVDEASATTTDLDAIAVNTYVATVVDSFEATEDEAQTALYQNVRDYVAAKALNEAYTADLAAANETAYARIAPKADELLARLDAGEDFATVCAAESEDSGMQGTSTTATNGYAVCENFSSFDSAFTAAAMAIPEVGGHSDKTAGSYGYYIIGYVAEVQEGPVDLADVKDGISADLLSTKQDTTYDEAVAAWIAAANAKIDKNALNDN